MAIPLSRTAISEAATAYCVNRSIRRASLRSSPYASGWKSFTSAAMETWIFPTSKRVIGATPLFPLSIACQFFSTPVPRPVMRPVPVTTTRRLDIRQLQLRRRGKPNAEWDGAEASGNGTPTGASTAQARAEMFRRLLGMLAEFRRPLLPEGLDALMRLLGSVEQGHGLHAHASDAADVLGIGVERTLGDGERGRAALEELAAPALDLGVERVRGDDGVDQPHRERLGRAVAPARVPHLPRLLLPHDPPEVGGAETGIDRAHLRADLAEDRGVGGDGQIAHRGQHVAPADRVAAHLGDNRLGRVADGGVHLFHGEAQGAASAVASLVRRLVAACRESPLAGAGEDDHADRSIPCGAAEGVDQLLAGAGAERVEDLRSVDGHARHPIGGRIEDVLIVHGRAHPHMVSPPDTL